MSLLERRRALIMGQNELPNEFIKLNYIEGTGTQWIDTGYTCMNDITPNRIKCKFKMTDISSGSFIFGTNNHSSGVAYVLSLSIDVSRGMFVFSRIGTSGSGLRFGTLDTELHDFEYVFNEGLYIDNVFVDGSEKPASLTDVASRRHMGLFGRLSEGSAISSNLGKCRIYSFEMYGDGGMNQILVPAQRKSDWVIGMYDTVYKKFLTNSGAGEFIGG